MGKLILVDGIPHRMRRGKLVEIPEKWLGSLTTKQTMRKRKSKANQGASYKRKVQR